MIFMVLYPLKISHPGKYNVLAEKAQYKVIAQDIETVPYLTHVVDYISYPFT